MSKINFHDFIPENTLMQTNYQFLAEKGLTNDYLLYSLNIASKKESFNNYTERFKLSPPKNAEGFKQFMDSTFETYLNSKKLRKQYANFMARTRKQHSQCEKYLGIISDFFINTPDQQPIPSVKEIGEKSPSRSTNRGSSVAAAPIQQ